MLTLTLFISFLVYSVSGNGQMVVLQSPDSLKFSGNDVIDADVIPDVFAASLGFTVRKSSNWPGLNVDNPFNFAEQLVVVAVEGLSSLGEFGSLPTYPVALNQDEAKTWRAVQNDVFERYPMIDVMKNFVRVELGIEGVDISDVSVKHLQKDKIEDAAFIESLAELKTYIDQYEKTGINLDGIPQVHWFVLTSLHNLIDVKGAHNPAVLEAKQMVREALVKLGAVVRDATNGRALVVALVSNGAHTRRERDTESQAAYNSTAPGNRATIYSEDYPAIFNIILWFSVAFIFSLIAISYFIAAMDPGRDSIIYRMTSNRMKKDS